MPHKKLLLAEDSVFDQLMVKKILTNDYELHVVNNGQELIDKYAMEDFDAILTDLEMPIVNGYEATLAIRNNFSMVKKDIPIIAMSSTSPSPDMLQKYKFSGFVSKPFDASELARIFNQKEIRASYSLKYIDMEPLLSFSGDNKEYFVSNINMFLDNIHLTLQSMVNDFKNRNFIGINSNAKKILTLTSFFIDEYVAYDLLILCNEDVYKRCSIYEITGILDELCDHINEIVLYLRHYKHDKGI